MLSAEGEAESRISDARKRASAIRARADEKASAIIAGARDKAVTDSKARLERARSEAREKLDTALAEASAAGGAFASAAEKAAETLVADIADLIAGRS